MTHFIMPLAAVGYSLLYLLLGGGFGGAVLIFIVAGAVRWREGLVLLATAILGAYCGSLIGRRAPAGAIRAVTVWLSAGITMAFFVRAYLK